MADVISPTNQIVSGPAVAPNDMGATKVVQPHTAFAYNHSSDDPFSSNDSTINGKSLSTQFPRTSWSRDASPGSFIGHVYSEKIPEQSSHRVPFSQSIPNSQEQIKGSDGTPTPLRNGTYHDPMADDLSNNTNTQKRKSGGLRTTLRRIFGRKSAKNRISLPAPAGAQHNVSSWTSDSYFDEEVDFFPHSTSQIGFPTYEYTLPCSPLILTSRNPVHRDLQYLLHRSAQSRRPPTKCCARAH